MKKLSMLIAFVLIASASNIVFATDVTIFGPNKYVRESNKPQKHKPHKEKPKKQKPHKEKSKKKKSQKEKPKKHENKKGGSSIYSDTFEAFEGQGKLIIINGNEDGSKRISSAEIEINGQKILRKKDLNQKVEYLELTLDFTENNDISVKLNSKPGSFLTVEIIQEDPTAPPANLIALSGMAFDASIAFANVSLKKMGSDVLLAGPVKTDALGEFTIPDVDLAGIDSHAILYLHVIGQGGSGGCDEGSPNSSTYVDINVNGLYDETDICTGAGAELKSILGIAGTLTQLYGDITGVIDSADMPELLVTHITTAKAIMVENLLKGSDITDPDKVAFLMDAINNLLVSDELLKLQIAKLAAAIKAGIHQMFIDQTDGIGKSIFEIELLETIKEMAKGSEGSLVINADDNAIINAEFQNDINGLMAAELNLVIDDQIDLSLITDFSNAELVGTLIDFDTIQQLNQQHIADNEAYSATYTGGVMNSVELIAHVGTIYHPLYLHNGRNGLQHTYRIIDWLKTHPVQEEIYLDVQLSRLHDQNGYPLFFKESEESFVTEQGENLPVYRRLGKWVTRFENDTTDQGNLSGYAVVDGSGELKYIGNRQKFDVSLSPRNKNGEKRIYLKVRDPYQELRGGRFEINSVRVETDDDYLKGLSGDALFYRGDDNRRFKVNCVPANFLDGVPVDKNILCLNYFELGPDTDAAVDYRFWSHRSNPGTSGRYSSYKLPYLFDPTIGSKYTFEIDYTDTNTGFNYTGPETIEKSLGKFPSDAYLAKFVKADGNLLIGDIVGDDSSLTIHWTYKATVDSPEQFYPSSTYQNIWLWDSIGEQEVPTTSGTEYYFSSNTRKMVITGDYSSYKMMELGVNLNLPNGGRATTTTTLIRQPDGNWIAQGLTSAILEDFLRYRKDLVYDNIRVDASLWAGIRTAGQFTPAISVSDSSDFYLMGDEVDYNLEYNPWKLRWDVNNDFGYVGEGTSAELPSVNITFTPDFDSTSKTLSVPRVGPKTSSDHLVSYLTLSIVDSKLKLDWGEPASNNTLNQNNRYTVRVEWAEDDENWERTLDYEETNQTTLTTDEAIPDEIVMIEARVEAIHNGWNNYGQMQLTCTRTQIVAGDCKIEISDFDIEGNLIVNDSASSGSITKNGDTRIYTFDVDAGSSYAVEVTTGMEPGDWDNRMIGNIQVFDSNWNEVNSNWFGDGASVLGNIFNNTSVTGTYKIVVQDNAKVAGGSDFNIRVYSMVNTDLTIDTPVSDSFTANENGNVKTYSFYATAGENYSVNITSNAPSEGWENRPIEHFYVQDPEGNHVNGFSSGDGENQMGLYLFDLQVEGEYSITVQDNPSNESGFSFDIGVFNVSVDPLNTGDTATHSIISENGADAIFAFSGAAGGNYIIEVSINTPFDNWEDRPINQVAIFDANFNRVGIESGGEKSITSYLAEVPENEQYLIMVSDNVNSSGGATFDIKVSDANFVTLIAGDDPVSRVVSPTQRPLFLVDLVVDNYEVKFTPDNDCVNKGGSVYFHYYNENGYWDGLVSNGFADNYGATFFINEANAGKKYYISVLHAEWAPDMEQGDCTFTVSYRSIDQDGTSGAEAIMADEIGQRSYSGSLAPFESRVYTFEADYTGYTAIAIDGIPGSNWQLYGDQNLTVPVGGGCDAESGGDNLECRVILTAGATYYLQFQNLNEYRTTYHANFFQSPSEEIPLDPENPRSYLEIVYLGMPDDCGSNVAMAYQTVFLKNNHDTLAIGAKGVIDYLYEMEPQSEPWEETHVNPGEDVRLGCSQVKYPDVGQSQTFSWSIEEAYWAN